MPPHKLLEMDLKEGWGPLCDFLGVGVPDEPLPRANDTDAANAVAANIARRVLQIWTMGLGAIAVIIVATGLSALHVL